MKGSKGKKKAPKKEQASETPDALSNNNTTAQEDPLAAMLSSTNKKKKEAGSFASMSLKDFLLKAIKRKGYQFPTPIQRKTIPVLLGGKDAVAMARTGSGKTAAFVLPLLQRLEKHSNVVGARAIVLAPTRELILQTHKFIKEFGKYTDLRCCTLVGGDSFEKQFEQLAHNPDIIVATPGRLMHIINETGLSLKTIEYVVFDEADRLFEMGMKEQLHEILGKLPSERQSVLVSATLPSVLSEFVKVGLNEPEFVRLDADMKISDQLVTAFFGVRPEEKEAALIYLLRDIIKSEQQSIIFACTRHHCEYLHDLLEKANVESVCIYGSMDQKARVNHLQDFKNRKVMNLIVTDVASRGIDIPLLDNVINYDFPPKPKLFVHRVGRAARAGRTGTAYSIVTPDDLPYVVDLHLFLGKSLKTSLSAEEKEDAEKQKEMFKNDVGKQITLYNGVYGIIPSNLMDVEIEEVVRITQESADVYSEKGVCERAYKLYSETRAKPSKPSIARAKEVEKKVHPLFEGKLRTNANHNTEVVKQQDLLAQIKQYRPHSTVFEMGSKETVAANIMKQRRTFKAIGDAFKVTRSTEDEDMEEETEDSKLDTSAVSATSDISAASSSKSANEDSDEDDDSGDENMETEETGENSEGDDDDEDDEEATAPTQQQKTALLASRILRKRKTAAAEPVKKNYKDEKFYISYEPDGVNAFEEKGFGLNDDMDSENMAAFRGQFEDYTLDLNAEDREELAKQNRDRSSMKWDKKKGNYVRAQDQSKTKKIRNESGALVKKGDATDLYQRWKKKTKARIQRPGELEMAQNSISKPITFEEELNNVLNDDSSSSGKRKRKRHRGQDGEASGESNNRKRKAETELKSKDQIKKRRKEDQKQKQVLKVREDMKKFGREKVKEKLHQEGMMKAIQKRMEKSQPGLGGKLLKSAVRSKTSKGKKKKLNVRRKK